MTLVGVKSLLFFQDMTSFHKAQAAKFYCSGDKWSRHKSAQTPFLAYDPLFT